MKKLKTQSGFGLIEVMLASTILVIVIVAVFLLAAKSLELVALAREKVAAYNLAQAQIEWARQAAEKTTVTSAATWADNFKESSAKSPVFNSPLKMNNVEYTISSSFDFLFLPSLPLPRIFPSSQYLNNNSVKYTVKVSWNKFNRRQTIEVATVFSNWRE